MSDWLLPPVIVLTACCLLLLLAKWSLARRRRGRIQKLEVKRDALQAYLDQLELDIRVAFGLPGDWAIYASPELTVGHLVELRRQLWKEGLLCPSSQASRER